jgi:hypothetical protein
MTHLSFYMFSCYPNGSYLEFNATLKPELQNLQESPAAQGAAAAAAAVGALLGCQTEAEEPLQLTSRCWKNRARDKHA